MQSLGHLCQAVREVGDEVLNGCNSERVSGPGSTSVTNLIFGNISRSRAMAPCSRLLMYYSLAADPCGPAKHCPVFHRLVLPRQRTVNIAMAMLMIARTMTLAIMKACTPCS